MTGPFVAASQEDVEPGASRSVGDARSKRGQDLELTVGTRAQRASTPRRDRSSLHYAKWPILLQVALPSETWGVSKFGRCADASYAVLSPRALHFEAPTGRHAGIPPHSAQRVNPCREQIRCDTDNN